MRCPADHALEPEQVDFLHAVAPEIALALAVCIAQPRQVRHIQLEAQLDERRTIAYDLHNSLAQQAGYLRLNLDRLSSDPDLLMADSVRGELRQMRDVADEVYEHIRNSLAGLRSQDFSDLTTTITQYAGIVARRADLSIEVQTTGTPAVLPPACNQQVFSLLREGLNNIEKHAHARQVQLQLNWSAEELFIELLDDGIGFDQIALADGHYGLIMIREQVTEMGGEVYVESTLGRGTRLKFLIPLAWMLARQPLWQSGSLLPQELE
jgi:signal transduction histidine kinase